MTDTSTSIGLTPPFAHCVAGMHIGRMLPMPQAGEFDAVLTVGAEPGVCGWEVRHKHEHIPYGPDPDIPQIETCANWVQDQIGQDRSVLIRSEGGRQRPGLIVAVTVLRLGGHYLDAINCVRNGAVSALTDFRYLNVLKAIDAELNARTHGQET